MEAGGDGVEVSYLLTKDDVRAAARVAAKVLPARRKLKLVMVVLMVLGAVIFDIGFVTDDGSVPLMTAGLVMMILSFLLASDRYFAYAVLRSHVAREFLLKHPERQFRADAEGVTFSTPTSTGSYAWSAVQNLVDRPDAGAVVFVHSSQAFNFVPTHALTEADRSTLQSLSGRARGGVSGL
jgi:hypothetical protein